MFALIIIMVAACVWVEMRIVNSFPVVGKICERYRIMSLAFSFVLSMLMGAAFGAAGLIVFAAGIISTVVIQPWYVMRANGTIEKFHAAKKQFRENWDAKKEVYFRRGMQVANGIRIVFKIVMFPFLVIGMIMDRMSQIQKAVEDAGTKVGKFFSTKG